MSTTHQKTWSRGKKKLTPSQLEDRKYWQKERVKITNFVRRKPEIDKSCVICGKPGHILHNKSNPYCISFICDECSKNSDNINIAKSKRYDIRSKLDKTAINITNFQDADIKRIVEGYLSVKNISSIADYCTKCGISRYKFIGMIKRYEKMTNKKLTHTQIKNKTNTLRMSKLIEVNKNKSK